jgi:hypothetical protein
MILYSIKNLRPDIENVVRNLAKYVDCVTLATYKEMLRVIRFVLDNQLFYLKMEQKNEED